MKEYVFYSPISMSSEFANSKSTIFYIPFKKKFEKQVFISL